MFKPISLKGLALGLAWGLALALSQVGHAQGEPVVPGWVSDARLGEVFYKRGAYNFDVYNVDPLARDLNGVAVGHSMAYEDLVTGKAAQLETKTYDRIVRVLKSPPKLMPAERFISPTFGRKYGYLEKLFDWTHILHAQTIDVLASADLTPEQKDKELEALWKFYKSSAPYTVTGLPLNMEFLDSQPYSGAFRRKYPKVNGLFWGYHWLQGAVYDMLWKSRSKGDMTWQYELVGKQYRESELYKTDRDFMPMFAETSPAFARRFPQMANAFDNLHMLHDMVNDILATNGMTEAQREAEIKRAIAMVVDDSHKGEDAGDQREGNAFHDHRSMEGQPGMGMMKMASPQLMFMPGMGWMSMNECGHCSMPMVLDPKAGYGATVSAEGWTMEVRCMLCARDMAAQVSGQALVRGNTEDPNRPLLLKSDDEGNWTANLKDVVFLEVEGPHATCSEWSRAFTSRAAFDAYVKAQQAENEEDESLKNAKPLTLKEWSARQGKEPDTYEKKQGPVPNPYKTDKKAEPAKPEVPKGAQATAKPAPKSCCSGDKK
jgi:hypothetical protein